MPRCQLCRAEFEASKPQARFCSSKCRSKAWQRARREAILGALAEAERALQRARAELLGEGWR